MEPHHPHHHDLPGHKENPWKHYLIEFLMLFFAVTLGFYSENIRESISNHSKEKDFMFSMIEDLKNDTSTFNAVYKTNTEVLAQTDSLIHLLRRPDRADFGATMYYFVRIITVNGA